MLRRIIFCLFYILFVCIPLAIVFHHGYRYKGEKSKYKDDYISRFHTLVFFI